MTIGELVVKLGIVADTDKAKGFSTALKDVTVGGAAAVAGLIGVSLQFKHLFEESIDAAMGLQMFNSQTGLSTEQLQKWQVVAERANVSAESVATSITALQRNIADIRMGRGNIAPFQLLGIDIRQDPFQILNQLRERIAGLPRPLAANLIQQLGFSPDMIQLLSLTNKQLKDLAGPDLIISEKNQRRLLQTRLEIVKLRQEFMAWSRSMMGELAPAFKFVGMGIEHLMAGLLAITEFLRNSKPAFYAFITIIGILAAAFFPITATVLGLILIFDDLYTYLKGGKSAFGELIKELDKLADKYKWLKDILDLNKRVGAAIDKVLGAPLEAAGYIATTLPDVRADLKGGAGNRTMVNNISGYSKEEMLQSLKELFRDMFSKEVTQTNTQVNNAENQ